MDPLTVTAVAMFGAIVVGGTAGLSLALERRRINRTLRNVATVELAADDLRARTLAAPARNRLLTPLLNRSARAVRRFTPVHQLERFERKLLQAGHPEGWDAPRLAAIRFFGRLGGAALTVVLLLSTGTGLPAALVLSAAVALLFHMGPDVLLDGRIRARQTQVQQGLADAIDLVVIMVEAGLGFDAALARAARQTPGALGEELHRTVQEIHLGRSRAQALRGLADRTDIVHVRTLVTALIQGEQFGLTLGDVLRTQADELRERRRQDAEEHAQKIPVKVLIPLIFFILPCLFTVLLAPGVIQIYENLIR